METRVTMLVISREYQFERSKAYKQFIKRLSPDNKKDWGFVDIRWRSIKPVNIG